MTTLRAIGTGSRGRGPGGSVALALGSLLVLLPIVLVGIPPLLDYPGHLAKVFIAHSLLIGQRDFAAAFQLNFRFFPNYAVDAIVLPLVGLGVDIEVAGRICLALTVLLVPIGVVRVHARLFGRGGFWPLLGFAFVFNQVLMLGFVNYLLGVGLSLNGFAWWLDLRKGAVLRRTAFCCAWVALCFFAHLIGALVFLGFVVSYETADLVLAWRAPGAVTQSVRRLSLLAIPVGFFAVLYSATPFSAELADDSLWQKLAGVLPQAGMRVTGMLRVADAYMPLLDRTFAAAVGLVVIVALATRRLHFAPRMLPANLGLAAIYLLVPETLAGTDYLPERIPILLLAVVLASSEISLASDVAASLARIAVIAGIALRSVSALQSWQASERVYAPMLDALERVPRGATIYTALNYRDSSTPDRLRPWRHFDCFGAIREGLIPASVFSNPDQDSIKRTPAFAAVGGVTPWDNRTDINPRPLAANDMLAPDLLATYDYLLAIRPDLYQLPLPAILHPIARSGDAVLFKIDRPNAAALPPAKG